jgi:hypothetical protein
VENNTGESIRASAELCSVFLAADVPKGDQGETIQAELILIVI